MTPPDLPKTDRSVLFEVATHPGTYASAISRRLALDGRTVSRSIIRLEHQALLTRTLCPLGAGHAAQKLTLTTTGMATALVVLATKMTEVSNAAD